MEAKKELDKVIEFTRQQGGYIELSFNEKLYNCVSNSKEFEDITDDWQIYNDVEQFQNLDGNIIIVFLSDFSMIVEVKEELKWAKL